jgi:hypothetical protein
MSRRREAQLQRNSAPGSFFYALLEILRYIPRRDLFN